MKKQRSRPPVSPLVLLILIATATLIPGTTTLALAAGASGSEGAGNFPAGGALIETQLDHRMAMAFLVLGLAANQPVRIDDVRPIATSFPDFVPLMARLGASFTEAR